MKNKNKIRKRKRLNMKNTTIAGSVLVVLGKLIYNDLKNENSLIKNILKKIPVFNKTLVNSSDTNNEEYIIIDDPTVIKNVEDNNLKIKE